MFISFAVYSQNYKGYNVFDYTTPPESFTFSPEHNYYYTTDIGYFDVVYFMKDNLYHFECKLPTAMKYTRIYNELVDIYGSESFNDDYIPAYTDANNLDDVSALIDLGKAELYKIWDLPDKKARIGLKYCLEKGQPYLYVIFASQN